MTATAINLKLRINMTFKLTTDELIKKHGITTLTRNGFTTASAAGQDFTRGDACAAVAALCSYFNVSIVATTEDLIKRYGLTVSAHLGNWHISAPRLTPTSVMHPNRSTAVNHFCRLHKLETETQVVPIPETIEQLIERHKITVGYLGGNNWRADVGHAVGDGLKCAYGNTAAGAINELVAQIEKREAALHIEKERTKAEASAFVFATGGYVGNHSSNLPQSEWGEAKAPAKKPAETIAEARRAAEKRILECVKSEAEALKNSTGAMVTGVGVEVNALRIMGSHECAAVSVNGVTITTG